MSLHLYGKKKIIKRRLLPYHISIISLFITVGSHSAHLAYLVHKSGHTPSNIHNTVMIYRLQRVTEGIVNGCGSGSVCIFIAKCSRLK